MLARFVAPEAPNRVVAGILALPVPERQPGAAGRGGFAVLFPDPHPEDPMHLRSLAVVAAVGALAALPSSASAAEPPAKVAATCTKRNIFKCTEFFGSLTAEDGSLCTRHKGVLAKDGKACPTGGLVGTCVAKSKGGVPMDEHYYGGARDPQGVCKLVDGKWEPAAKP